MGIIEEDNKIILKNLICFFLSLFPRFSLLFFEVFLKSENIYLKDELNNYFGIIVFGPFVILVLFISLLFAVPFFIMTIKYIIKIIKSKKKIIIPIIEIIIYIFEIIKFLVIIING